MKKALAGILSTAMIFTSGVIPNTLTSVQVATTYNDTTTANVITGRQYRA